MPGRQDLYRTDRSGRFKFRFADANDSKLIIKGRAGTLYRIYSSRVNDFVVSNGGTDLRVLSGNSIDVRLSGDISIKPAPVAMGNPALNVSGIYEELLTDAEPRTGRIKIREAATTKRDVLYLLGPNRDFVYRFFNSGDNPFRIWNVATGSDEATVEKSQSIDISLDAGRYQVHAAEPYELIYELIG